MSEGKRSKYVTLSMYNVATFPSDEGGGEEEKRKALAHFLSKDHQLMHNYENSNTKHFNREAIHLKYEPEKELVTLCNFRQLSEHFTHTSKIVLRGYFGIL